MADGRWNRAIKDMKQRAIKRRGAPPPNHLMTRKELAEYRENAKSPKVAETNAKQQLWDLMLRAKRKALPYDRLPPGQIPIKAILNMVNRWSNEQD